MNIIMINTYDVIGGAARAAFRLFQGLSLVGSNCRLFVLRQSSDAPGVVRLGPLSPEELERAEIVRDEIVGASLPYPVLQQPPFVAFHSERAIVGEAMVNQLPAADVVNLHWVREFVDYRAFFSSRPPGQPVVWTLHDMLAFTGGCHYAKNCTRYAEGCGSCPFLESDDPRDLSHHILRRKLGILAEFRNRLHVVSPSRWLAREAQRSILFRDVPVSVIPNSIDTVLFSPEHRREARQSLGLPPDLRVILFIAHNLTDPRKGFKYLDEALCRLGPQPNLVLLLVGDGNPEIMAPVPVLRAGELWDDAAVSNLYAAADLAVLPSLEDNLPNTVLEAMASGVPVIGFDVGGVPDLIIPGETGFLVPLRDSFELSRAVSSALGDPARLGAMGRAARSLIERNHTLEVQANSYLELYRSLLG
jgi:glycosyltransferase involved in cell wall biosynthesis